jgi:hypothetical protein
MGASASVDFANDIENGIKEKLKNIDEVSSEFLFELEISALQKLKLGQSAQSIDPAVYEHKEFCQLGHDGVETKRIVVLCDGTANRRQETNNTNIAILFDLLSQRLEKGHENIAVKYFPGMATEKDSTEAAVDFVTGFSVNLVIIQILSYVFDNYNDGDELILMGFSRGSLLIRIICGILRWNGISKNKNHRNAKEVVVNFRGAADAENGRGLKEPQGNLDDFYLPNISFVGLFDTVPGLPKSYLDTVDWFFHVEDMKPMIKSVCHIMADSGIAAFRNVSYFSQEEGGLLRCLKNLPQPNDFNSVTYKEGNYLEFRHPGSHVNIGGGGVLSPESELCLSNNTLRLMIRASPLGIFFDDLLANENTSYPIVPLTRRDEYEHYVYHQLSKEEMGEKYEFRRRMYLLIEELAPAAEPKKAEVVFACKQQQEEVGN